ncbi:MAG: hypothetical protein K9M56_03660 [Victivallales bacterium]|nr:hypothetical protein [Victivallales bacterium]
MEKRVEFLYLQQEECIKAGGRDMEGCLKAVERSFFLHGKNDYIQPGKPVIRWGGPETEEVTGRIMSMPSFLGGENYSDELESRNLIGPVNTSGIKYIPSRPHNPARFRLPRANAVIIISNPDSLMPSCIMDGTLISAMRTGAASGVAAKYLAKKTSKVLGLVGAGVQGITQVMAMKGAVPALEECRVYDINPKIYDYFSEKMKANNVDIKLKFVDTVEEAFIDSDVISTATMAKKPYVKPEWYKEGALHCEISFWDTPAEALKVMDFVVVDDWYQVKHHGVDVSWRAVRDGVISDKKIRGNLGEIITGSVTGRSSDKEKIFFNPIGMGIHDLSEAHRIYRNAEKMGLGKKIPLWDEPIFG